MTHTCEDCGGEFETLSALRLHDCPDEQDDGLFTEAIRESMAKRSEERRKEDRRARRAAPDDLEENLTRAAEGEPDAIHEFLGVYERELAATYGDDGYWGLYRVFHEPAVEVLDDVVATEGWSYLLEILEAYWPETTLDFEGYEDISRFDDYETRYADWGAFPHVSHVLTNVTSRHLIRTRRDEGVEAIPADALQYLAMFHRHPADEGAWLESMAYGWGIGHPDHSVVETIIGVVDGAFDVWAGAVIEHAIHADQAAAADLLETVFDRVEVSHPAMLLRGISQVAKDRYPTEPQYFDWEDENPELETDGFVWDDDVRQRLRDVVEESGVFGHRPGEWTFEDLEV
ncbi:MAG: hypothetical protein V5A27_08325 [Halapricum sp.]